MAFCPRWAQNNADRVFDLVRLDGAELVRQVVTEFEGQMTLRRFRRAVMAVQHPKVIKCRQQMLLGWQRTLLAEDDRAGLDASISLIGFVPRWSSGGIEFERHMMGVFVHKHALARLFQRALQPPEDVAAGLLSPHFVSCFPPVTSEDFEPGFAVPFQKGRFVGSLEWVRDVDGALMGLFGIRSWLPDPLSEFRWTDKASRTRLRAIDLNRRTHVLDLLHAEKRSSHGIEFSGFPVRQRDADASKMT